MFNHFPSGRVQKLLKLCAEYSEFEDESKNIILEGPFVQESKNGEGIRQVYVALSLHSIFIAHQVINETARKYLYPTGDGDKDPDLELEGLELLRIMLLKNVFVKATSDHKIEVAGLNGEKAYYEYGIYEDGWRMKAAWAMWQEVIRGIQSIYGPSLDKEKHEIDKKKQKAAVRVTSYEVAAGDDSEESPVASHKKRRSSTSSKGRNLIQWNKSKRKCSTINQVTQENATVVTTHPSVGPVTAWPASQLPPPPPPPPSLPVWPVPPSPPTLPIAAKQTASEFMRLEFDRFNCPDPPSEIGLGENLTNEPTVDFCSNVQHDTISMTTQENGSKLKTKKHKFWQRSKAKLKGILKARPSKHNSPSCSQESVSRFCSPSKLIAMSGRTAADEGPSLSPEGDLNNHFANVEKKVVSLREIKHLWTCAEGEAAVEPVKNLPAQDPISTDSIPLYDPDDPDAVVEDLKAEQKAKRLLRDMFRQKYAQKQKRGLSLVTFLKAKLGT